MNDSDKIKPKLKMDVEGGGTEALAVPEAKGCSRRHFVISTAVVAGSLVGSAAVTAASDSLTTRHEHHHSVSRHEPLIASALDCIKAAQLCREHCIAVIKTGDTMLIDCLDIVNDTIVACEALVSLAASDSKHLGEFASVCMNICRDCETECELHKDMHQECKNCMLSCRSCIEHLEKVAA